MVAFLLFVCCLPTFAADWPQFRGPHRDGKSPETGLLQQWPETGLAPLWIAEGLGKGFSSAVVGGDRAYVTGMNEEDQGLLFAFNLNGTPQWKQPYGPEWSGTYPGTRSIPTVDGAHIYLRTGLGVVISFAKESGAIQWSKDLTQTFGGEMPVMGYAESLLIDGPRLICTPGGADASIVALDKTNGETLWTTHGFSEQNAYCAPILIERGGTRLIVTITAQSMVGVDPATGALFWRTPFDLGEKDTNHSVAPVYDRGRLYATSGHGEGGQMLTLSPDGKAITQQWTDATLNTLHGGLVVVDGYVYGSSTKGKWVCLKLDTGEVMYEEKGIGKGSLIHADGMLYAYSEKGTLALVKATPESFAVVSSFKVTHGDAQHWAHPTLAHGRLFIRHGDALIAYDLRAN